MTAPHMHRLTLDDVWDLVGHPSRPGAIYSSVREGSTLYGWEDEVCGRAGWWWAVVRQDLILDHGWTAGGRVDRDNEFARAIERLRHVVAQPRGAA